MNTICFLLLTLCGIFSVIAIKDIPEHLKECYKNENIWDTQLPLNLRVIIDIIRKIEKQSYSRINLRMLSTSLLRSFKLDGIRYNDRVLPSIGILPFIADQPQRIKQEIVEELIPGNSNALPVENLTLLEYCTLHQAISNTIWYSQRENEDNFCISGPFEKITGRIVIKGKKFCPKENGVILTEFGTVALGNVINAIAASLVPQKVKIDMLLSLNNQNFSENENSNYNYNEEEVDLIVPKNQMMSQRSMWTQTLSSSSPKLDNIWAATLAGELAEVVIYQGPIFFSAISIGATGFWNSSIRPAAFYISEKRLLFEATRAEIIGSVDGLVIAKNLPIWMEKIQSLRLSQILDMYYSNRGVSFNRNIKACERGRNFMHIAPGTIIEEQTFAFSKLLGFRNGAVYMSDEILQHFVNYATNTFSYYVNNHVFTELNCHKDIHQPRVELFVTFDGSWSEGYTTDFLSVLVEDVDVSLFGSKMGLIHATTGEWLFNLTNSPATVYENLRNLSKIQWPRRLNYTSVLETVYEYLETVWMENQENCKIGNIGQALLVLAPLTQLSENDQQLALNLILQIKQKHPEMHFLYFVRQENINVFENFIISEEDHLIPSSILQDITKVISEIPITIRPLLCEETQGLAKPKMEDYVGPSELNTYKLHSHWRSSRKKIIFTVHGVGYGIVKICFWTKGKTDDTLKDFSCQLLNSFDDITFEEFSPYSKENNCPNLYYQIHHQTSLIKCAEINCKSPHHVRFILEIETMYYSKCDKIISKLNLVVITIASLIYIF